MRIHICPLSHVPKEAATHQPSRLVSLLSPETTFPVVTMEAEDHHHRVAIDDIAEELPDHTPPMAHHVEELVRFLERWDPETPLLVHCWAGISRSTATAFTAACLHNPNTEEEAIALAIRNASPTACPNPRIVAFADAVLGREGRMSRAVEAIGRGQVAMEAEPFHIPARFGDA